MPQPYSRKAQSGAAPMFLAMAVLLWSVASLVAAFPQPMALLLAAGGILALLLAAVLWGVACWRR